MNRVIKRDLVRSMTLPQFAEHLQNLVRAQQQEVMLAMMGASEVYDLKPEYVDIAGCSQMEFYQKNDQQRSAAIKKFDEVRPTPRSMLPEPSYTPEETSVSPTCVAAPAARVYAPAALGIDPMKMQLISSSVTHIPVDVLNPILKKADSLVRAEDALIRLPSTEIQSCVKSKSRPNNPHVVQVKETKKGIQISCDESFAGFKMCLHTITASAKMGADTLDSHVMYVSQHQRTANLSAISDVGLAKGRGKKPKAINKRKFGPSSKSSATNKKTTYETIQLQSPLVTRCDRTAAVARAPKPTGKRVTNSFI